MERCNFCSKLAVFGSAAKLNEHIVKKHVDLSGSLNTSKYDKILYLFRCGILCVYCDTKLYSFRHMNEHLSYEHNVHIELEELVFFVPDGEDFRNSDFSKWKENMECKTNACYQRYICPISLVPSQSIPKKEFYRCANNIIMCNTLDGKPLVCPSSFEAYMDGDVLKVAFWRSHLCHSQFPVQDTVSPLSVETHNAVVDDTNFSIENRPNSFIENNAAQVSNKLSTDSQYLRKSFEEKQKSYKELLRKFTKRVLQTDLTSIDPCFNKTLDKVIPFLNHLLDKHEFTTRLKSEGKTPFIYYPSSDDESVSDLEDEALSHADDVFAKQIDGDSHIWCCENGLKKRKKENELGENAKIPRRIKQSETCDMCAKNYNGAPSIENDKNYNNCELYTHNGFDHFYTTKATYCEFNINK